MTSPLSILIAPDKFKGTLDAQQVAECIKSGIDSHGQGFLRSTTLPLADGGDGFVRAALNAGYDPRSIQVLGPTRFPRITQIAYNGETAIIEAASICGLSSLPDSRRDPLRATSHGVGDAIRYSAETLGARRVVVGLGGSATTDGGAGMLHALGARFVSRSGQNIVPAPHNLANLVEIDMTEALPLRNIEIIGASDVWNPLLGPNGTAAVFGPQKGASVTDIASLNASLRALTRTIRSGSAMSSHPGAGAAGGIGFGLLALGGTLTSGASFVLELLGFDALAESSDVVITGEGSLDAQTDSGKLVSVVANRTAPKEVIAVVGRSELSAAQTLDLGLSGVYTVADRSTHDTSNDPEESARVLRAIGAEIAIGLREDAVSKSA